MEYRVRKAEGEDLKTVLSLYEKARAFMRSAGNPSQWGNTYPGENLIKADLISGDLYVICEEEKIHGVFMFKIFEDPTYAVIREGSWHSGESYGVIHRVAGDGSGGILKAAVSYAEQFADCLRIDTHKDNLPMQKAILNRGFSYCGIIYTEQGDPRLAYDRIRK